MCPLHLVKYLLQLSIKVLQMQCPLLHLLELYFYPIQVLDRLQHLLPDACSRQYQIVRLQPDLFHCHHIHIDDILLLLPLLLLLHLDLHLAVPLHLLGVLLLDHHDPLVEFVQQMSQLRVDLVDQVGEVRGSLVVDVLEEDYRGVILLEVLHLVRGHLLLQDDNDVLRFSTLDVLGQVDDLFLQSEDLGEVAAGTDDLGSVGVDDLGADQLDLAVGLLGYFVDEVTDRQSSTLGKDVLDVLALDVAQVVEPHQQSPLLCRGHIRLVSFFSGRRPEEEHPLVLHQELDEVPLIFLEQIVLISFHFDHLLHLPDVASVGQLFVCPVDDQEDSVLDVLEGLEGFLQGFDQLGELVSPGLADVRLVDDQHQLHLLVDVQQPLDEEGVRDLVLLTLVVLEPGAVVERHVLDHDLRGH